MFAHERVLAVAAERPAAVAVEQEGAPPLSYGELAVRSATLASFGASGAALVPLGGRLGLDEGLSRQAARARRRSAGEARRRTGAAYPKKKTPRRLPRGLPECRGERIRTSGLSVPNRTRYQTALRPVGGSRVINRVEGGL